MHRWMESTRNAKRGARAQKKKKKKEHILHHIWRLRSLQTLYPTQIFIWLQTVNSNPTGYFTVCLQSLCVLPMSRTPPPKTDDAVVVVAAAAAVANDERKRKKLNNRITMVWWNVNVPRSVRCIFRIIYRFVVARHSLSLTSSLSLSSCFQFSVRFLLLLLLYPFLFIFSLSSPLSAVHLSVLFLCMHDVCARVYDNVWVHTRYAIGRQATIQ